jgi:MFS family permease
MERPLSRRERYALTSGELGAVSAQTVMVALLPLLLAPYAPSALWIGIAIGGEGVFALLLPFWSGALSDRVPPNLAARFGRRTIVVAGAALLLAGAVAVAPFLSGYWPLAAAAFVSFAGLHAYLTPFWALLIDAVPDGQRSSVQGIRGVFRSGGLAYGLVGAGLLFTVWNPLPFLAAAALVLGTTAITWAAERALGPAAGAPKRRGLREACRSVARNGPALWLLVADAFWNASVDGIRPYFFLYARRVLGTTAAQTSLGLLLLLAGVGAGSSVIGLLGDRYDRARILEVSSLALALAFAAGVLAQSIPVALALAAFAGVAAAAIMTLPYPLYAALVGGEAAGEQTGIFVVSVAAGRIFSPLLVGAVVDLAARWMPSQGGYPAMWGVSAALAMGGWLALRRSGREARRAASAAGRAPRATPARGSPHRARP